MFILFLFFGTLLLFVEFLLFLLLLFLLLLLFFFLQSIVARNSNEGVQSGSEQPSTANQRHSSQRSLARSGVRPSRPTGNDLQNSSGRKKKVATIHAERS